MKTIEKLKRKKGVYEGSFNNQEDVEREFDIKLTDKQQIIYADYNQEDYSGEAFVLFIQDNKLYEVNGSHCSCYGLEGQWDIEETSLLSLKYRLENGCHFFKDRLSYVLGLV